MTFSEFLQQYGIYLAFVIFFTIVILIIFFLIIPRTSKKVKEEVEPSVSKLEIIDLLGGNDNIKEVTLRGSRLSLVLVDQSLANIEELKKHGVDRAIIMQNKLVLLLNKEVASLFDELP